jgi:hypothetical protein
MVEAPPETNVLKLLEGLWKAESLLVIQLRTGINGLDAFLFQARVLTVSSPSAAVAEDNKERSTSLSSALSAWGHDTS